MSAFLLISFIIYAITLILIDIKIVVWKNYDLWLFVQFLKTSSWLRSGTYVYLVFNYPLLLQQNYNIFAVYIYESWCYHYICVLFMRYIGVFPRCVKFTVFAVNYASKLLFPLSLNLSRLVWYCSCVYWLCLCAFIASKHIWSILTWFILLMFEIFSHIDFCVTILS